jgi:esterase/lipase superfamily enzyme
MSPRIPIFGCCAALLVGCSGGDREQDQTASPSVEQRSAKEEQTLVEDLTEAPAQPRSRSGEETIAEPARDRTSPRLEEIRPLRSLPTGEDPSLVFEPSQMPRSPADSEAGFQPGRTALAPPVDRAPRASSSVGPPHAPYTTIRVFYGTNRAETGSQVPGEMYGTRRSETSFGFCDVSIPHNHQTGRLESPSIWRLEFREDPKKHIVLLRVLKQSRGQFLSALQQEVWSSMALVETPDGPALSGGEVFVFVHGYNTTFEDAARRTAQIAYDLKFAGAPVMYSWPSQAKSSLEAYRADGQMAGWSEEHLIDFVTTLARESGARRIHLIAHSMGNRIVSAALRRLVEQCASGRLPRFNEVILSAPDIDADYFKTAIAPRMVHSADRITIYSSSRDYALKISSFFNPLARRRLGEAGSELTVFPEYPNIDVIDATEVDTDLFALNHSYHADSPTILGDMQLLLQGYTTQERGLAATLNRLAWQIRNATRQLSEDGRPAVR